MWLMAARMNWSAMMQYIVGATLGDTLGDAEDTNERTTEGRQIARCVVHGKVYLFRFLSRSVHASEGDEMPVSVFR